MTGLVDIAIRVASRVVDVVDRFRRKKTRAQQAKISGWSKDHYFPDADWHTQCFYCGRFKTDTTKCDGRLFL